MGKGKEKMEKERITPVKYEEGKLIILDQTELPAREKWIVLENSHDVWDAVKKLKVRGAPAIGVCAAYGICVSMEKSHTCSYDQFRKEFSDVKDYLISSRPTAVNLAWALERMEKKLLSIGDGLCFGPSWRQEEGYLKEELLKEAHAIRREDEESCRAMGEYGLRLLTEISARKGAGEKGPEDQKPITVLTHCNAGALATAGYGTCLAPVYLAAEKGYGVRVFSDETRPLLQGARLTCWELARAGIDVTLICDDMAYSVLKKEKPHAVVVGCDRMAANGDGANKIGTAALAVMAKELGIPFFMFAPKSTIDLSTPAGEDIRIEERDGDEICSMWYEERMAPEGIKTFNPAFDVTENRYITAVVTEKGVVYPPFDENLKRLFE